MCKSTVSKQSSRPKCSVHFLCNPGYCMLGFAWSHQKHFNSIDCDGVVSRAMLKSFPKCHVACAPRSLRNPFSVHPVGIRWLCIAGCNQTQRCLFTTLAADLKTYNDLPVACHFPHFHMDNCIRCFMAVSRAFANSFHTLQLTFLSSENCQHKNIPAAPYFSGTLVATTPLAPLKPLAIFRIILRKRTFLHLLKLLIACATFSSLPDNAPPRN